MELTPDKIHELSIAMANVTGEEGEAYDLTNSLIKLLTVPDEQFNILAPGIMQSFQQSINNPNDKIALVQALNAAGNTAEDINQSLFELIDDIEKLSISRQKRDFLKELTMSIVSAVNGTEGIAKRNISIPIELCHPEASIPQYAHISDSGMDVFALDDVTIKPGETKLISTGIKVALPPGFELQVRPKSGRVLKTKLRIANTPGTIDQGYRDEIGIIVENIESPIKDITIEDGKITSILYGQDYTIGKGEKFCQLILCEVPKAVFYRVDSVKTLDDGDRGGGFGSTGLV